MVFDWFKKKIAKSSNIVDTADILARSFLGLKLKYPGESISEIYKRTIDFRYAEIDIPSINKLLITSQISDKLPFEQFAWAVLMAELEIHKTQKDFQEMAFENVRKTLRKYKDLPYFPFLPMSCPRCGSKNIKRLRLDYANDKPEGSPAVKMRSEKQTYSCYCWHCNNQWEETT